MNFLEEKCSLYTALSTRLMYYDLILTAKDL